MGLTRSEALHILGLEDGNIPARQSSYFVYSLLLFPTYNLLPISLEFIQLCCYYLIKLLLFNISLLSFLFQSLPQLSLGLHLSSNT